jgi:hypothetical protein
LSRRTAWKELDAPPPPQLFEEIGAPIITAYSRPRKASLILPPFTSMNLSPMSCTLEYMPATPPIPTPLLVEAAITPAQCVPCPSLSAPEPEPLIKGALSMKL